MDREESGCSSNSVSTSGNLASTQSSNDDNCQSINLLPETASDVAGVEAELPKQDSLRHSEPDLPKQASSRHSAPAISLAHYIASRPNFFRPPILKSDEDSTQGSTMDKLPHSSQDASVQPIQASPDQTSRSTPDDELPRSNPDLTFHPSAFPRSNNPFPSFDQWRFYFDMVALLNQDDVINTRTDPEPVLEEEEDDDLEDLPELVNPDKSAEAG